MRMKVIVKKYLSVIVLCFLVLMLLGVILLQEQFIALLIPATLVASALVPIGICGYKLVKELTRKENGLEAKLRKGIAFGLGLLFSLVYLSIIGYYFLLVIAFSRCEGSCFTF